jgi:hypothetical protein
VIAKPVVMAAAGWDTELVVLSLPQAPSASVITVQAVSCWSRFATREKLMTHRVTHPENSRLWAAERDH